MPPRHRAGFHLGKSLITKTVGNAIEIRLVDGEPPDHSSVHDHPLIVVDVPTDSTDLAPLAKRWLAQQVRHEVSTSSLPRAALLVSAIIQETRRRRWSIALPDGKDFGSFRNNWTPGRDGHLVITVRETEFRIRVSEKGVTTRGKWDQDVKEASRPSTWRISAPPSPKASYDTDATGVLTLTLQGGQPWRRAHRRSNFSDQRDLKLEERLGQLFQEIEIRATETREAIKEQEEQRRQQAEAARLAAQERERQWHILMDKARTAFAEYHRVSELRKQLTAWEDVNRLRAYCDALETAQSDDQTGEWITWARSVIERMDPTNTSHEMPETPEPTPNELEPFLPEGWSPDGPSGRRW